MAKTNKVSPSSKQDEEVGKRLPGRNFQWSIQPMMLCLFVIGNVFTPLQRPPLLYRVFVYFWGLSYLAVCLTCHISQLYLTFQPLYAAQSGTTSENTNTVIVNLSIDYFSFFIFAAGIQMLLLFLTRLRWPDLCRLIVEVEKCMPIDPVFYKHLRWISFISFLLIIAVRKLTFSTDLTI